MFAHCSRLAFAALLFGFYVVYTDSTPSQEAVAPLRGDPAPAAAPEIPRGVEVQARGPIHEAFASPTTEPKQPLLIPKKPPLPIEELPPEEKPEGDAIWIGGYFSWDDDRADFMWVSGCWRVRPTGKEWVPGYWREVGDNWQWVSGFWSGTSTQEQKAQPVTYYPEPPAPPNVAPPGEAPRADMIYVPGYWMWTGDRYIWRAGYWTPGRPDYVYVPSHYRWTPYGYVYVPGYWDLAISRRGVLYAPIVVDVVVVGRGYRYTPYYAVRDTVVLDTLFVRPAFGIYYFGDYYGPRYVAVGFEPGIVYGRRYYDPLIVHERWVYRDNPRWQETQITLVVERNAGRAPLPPRRFEIGRANVMVAPARVVLADHGIKSVRLTEAARAQIHRETVARHEAMREERIKTERAGGHPTAPRESKLNVHATAPAVSHAPTPMGSTGPGAVGHPTTVGEAKDAKGPLHDPLKGGKSGAIGKKDEAKKKDR